jgi:hypothetical protein
MKNVIADRPLRENQPSPSGHEIHSASGSRVRTAPSRPIAGRALQLRIVKDVWLYVMPCFRVHTGA